MNKNTNAITGALNGWNITSAVLGGLLFIIGLANMVWVHPVPGLVFIAVALLYLPVTDTLIQKKLGFKIPNAVKIILALVMMWFTLGVSDLGDMIDKFW